MQRQYCSRDCQTSHWPVHKVECNSLLRKASWQPSWVSKGYKPAFVGDGAVIETFGHLNYLWGNVPAFDVLNIEKNEGLTYGKELDLCFAGKQDVECSTEVK